MRHWLIKQLGGVTLPDYERLYAQYVRQNLEFQQILNRTDMNNAWEQMKQERKLRRIH